MLQQEQRQCFFCSANQKVIDYKDAETLSKFLSVAAKIKPRKKTGLCAKHQRRLSQAVKRARFLALIPYTAK